MTQRRRLDAFLVEQAREAGAEFRDGFRPDDTIDAEVVIGADGANGTTGRAAGLDDHLRTVALEGNAAVDLERFAGRAWIEFGVVPGGYGWVFPKARPRQRRRGRVARGGPAAPGAPRPLVPRARDPRELAHRRPRPSAAASASRLDGGPGTPRARRRRRGSRRPGVRRRDLRGSAERPARSGERPRHPQSDAWPISARMQENYGDDSRSRRQPPGGRRPPSTASRERRSPSCERRSRGAGSSHCSAPTPRSRRTSAARAGRRFASRRPSPGCHT